jgi:hypothetical protein
MTTLTPEDRARLAEIRVLLEAGTKGPWKVETIPSDMGGEYITGHITAEAHNYAGNSVSRRDSVMAPDSMTAKDAYLVVALVNAAPWLLALVERIPGYSDDLEGR